MVAQQGDGPGAVEYGCVRVTGVYGLQVRTGAYGLQESSVQI